jgi:hypothetical protein
MFGIGKSVKLLELKNVPQSSVGAPCPVLLADEHHVFLAYFLQVSDSNWDGSSVRVVSPESKDEPVALVSFNTPYVHYFGPPNDEAISGHPLFKIGLKPYSVFEVINSLWIDEIEKMNSVHSYHNKDRFSSLKHFIFSFHDSVFECVAESFSVAQKSGSLVKVISEAVGELS